MAGGTLLQENIGEQAEEKRVLGSPVGLAKFLGFTPFDYQIEFLISCQNNNRVAGVWGRQLGKSTIVSIFALWYALLHRDSRILIVSPTQEQSDLLFMKIRLFAEKEALIANRIRRLMSDRIEFENLSEIKSLPSGAYGDTIRGHTADLVILEESARIKDEIVYEVIMPMIAAKPDAKIIQISTPKGRNHFYKAVMNEMYGAHHFTWRDGVRNFLIDAGYIEEQRNMMIPLKFRTEYEAEFMDSQDSLFTYEEVMACVDESLPKLTNSTNDKWQYVMGVDLGRFGEDSSVFTILEKTFEEEIKVVFIGETREKPLTDAIGRIKALNKAFKCKRIYIDETGMGGGVVDISREIGNIEGMVFTQKSKMEMYNNLKLLMQNKKIKIPNNEKLIYQLLDLKYEFKANSDIPKIYHPEGGHDDFPDSLALAAYYFAHKSKSPFMIV